MARTHGPGSMPNSRLQGVHRAHLVGDRADAADARDDVRHLAAVAPLEEFLEQARRLEDAQLERLDAPVVRCADRSAPSPSTRASTGTLMRISRSSVMFASLPRGLRETPARRR